MRKEIPPPERPGLPVRIWRSAFRGPLLPATDRERKWLVLNTLVLHLRPIRVPAATLRYTHTFGLGGSSLVLFLLLVATGVLLQFVYVPSPAEAHASILTLETGVGFGRLVRAVHHWSANLLLVVALLHLLRVFFTGGFTGRRQFNWVVGLGLLALVLASNFTGYLLPWDQLSYWAVTISTGMLAYVPGIGDGLQRVVRGGDAIGAATLLNFHALHTTVLPVTLIFLMALHFWRVRKAGGVVTPRRGGEERDARHETVLFLPNLLVREVAVALVLVAVVLTWATLADAPLGPAANPGMSPNPAKAPWYFLGFQELLIHVHPLFAVLVIPGLAALGLLLLPYLRYDGDTDGVWFRSARGRRLALVAAILGVVLAAAWVLLDEHVIDPVAWMPGLDPLVSSGLVPFLVLLAGVAVFHRRVRARPGTTRDEAVLAVFVLLAAGFAVLTVTGIWFRGAGMALVWPWEVPA